MSEQQTMAGVVDSRRIDVHVRLMIRRDMPEILAIEQESFDDPWTEKDFLRHLRQRNCVSMTADKGPLVVGYMVYHLHAHHIDLLTIAVHPQYRRAGVGAQMVSKLVGKLSSHRRTRISLEVRETNLPAQLFFCAEGFRGVKVLRNVYDDSGEDAFLMQYRLKG